MPSIVLLSTGKITRTMRPIERGTSTYYGPDAVDIKTFFGRDICMIDGGVVGIAVLHLER